MDKMLSFSYSDYRKYLDARLPVSGADRGLRSRLAEALRCQNAFVSRVISGEAHFSPDHAVQVSEFLGHSELEAEYFLLLVLESRASTAELISYYQRKREEILKKKDMFAERVRAKTGLTSEEQATYYSSWYYAAIHVLLTVESLQTPQAIAKHLLLPLNQTQRVLEFLEQVGLAKAEGERYVTGAARIHLGKGSPLLAKHHANWRVQAIQALDQGNVQDSFYSGPVSFRREHVETIREKIFRFIGELEPFFKEEGEDTVYCLNVDFFHI